MTTLLQDTRVWFTAFVLLVALQRLLETGISARNTRRLLTAGGREAGRGHLPAMIALHALFLAAAPAEVWLAGRAYFPALTAAALVLFLLAQGLRVWTLRTLGERWTVRVIYVPGARPVTEGPYRYVRHPNYLAVAAEIITLPLLHGAFVTAAVFSVLNAWLLSVRIRSEEALLAELGSYDSAMGARPRFLPRPGERARP